MGKKASKCLVIDTDIARAAGGESSKDARSQNCRDFIHTMLNATEHKVVLTKAIQEEWNKHQSESTLRWRRVMIAQKRVCFVQAPADEYLRNKIEQCAPDEDICKIMLKDIHLIEAASQADKIVISMDDRVRSHFRNLTDRIHLLKHIAWVNPCKDEEKPLDWLQNGANLEKERLLGHH